jgi:hypothetical protein
MTPQQQAPAPISLNHHMALETDRSLANHPLWRKTENTPALFLPPLELFSSTWSQDGEGLSLFQV